MNKVIKTAAKTAFALGATGFGVAAVVYECALNIKLSDKLGEKLNFHNPEQEKLYVTDYCLNANAWWAGHEKHEEIIVDKDKNTIHAMVVPAEEPSDKWAVICHGYTSSPEGMARYAYEYNKRGYNCLLPAFRGHAMDTNHYCSMGWYDKDMCVSWANWIVLQNPSAQIVIHGESMGAATTMLTTGEVLPSNVKAAVSDCGYSSVMQQYKDVLKSRHVPSWPLLQFVNMYSNLIGNFDLNKTAPVEAVAHSVTPTLFVHGDIDDFVPYENLERVYNACSAPKEKFTVHGAVHASSSTLAPEFYWENVDKFLAKYIK